MAIIFASDLLARKESVASEAWQVWEKKNFNIHRGVIEWNVHETLNSADELASRIRNGVLTEFRPGWFRGFGFGTILHFREIPTDLVNICGYIDTRNKKDGVWQWAVMCFDEDKRAIGVHTWLHGYLRPVYDQVLQCLAEQGYECESLDSDIDQLFIVLRRIADTCKAVKTIGGLMG